MENRDISMQLEEMREQIAMLKGKLENQKIVNEKQLRNSMTNKMSKIDRTMLGTVIAGLIALIYCTWFFTSLMHLSAAFTFATAALISACLVITLYKHHSFRRIDISRGNIIDVVERLTKINKHYNNWWKIALPILLVWYGWFAYELLTLYNYNSHVIGICVGCFVGGVIGLYAGFKINSKIVKETDEILCQIHELQQMQ